MINGIGKSIAGGIGATRSSAGQPVSGPAASTAIGASVSSAVGGTVAGLVGDGAPVDGDKVASIRAAIAEGRYTIDAGQIADAMLKTDMPHL